MIIMAIITIVACIIHITTAWAVDREFVNIYLVPVGVFGAPLSPPGFDSAVHLAPFGLSLGPLGGAWAAQGHIVGF